MTCWIGPRTIFDHSFQDRQGGGSTERRSAAIHQVEHATQAEQIALGADLQRLSLLG